MGPTRWRLIMAALFAAAFAVACGGDDDSTKQASQGDAAVDTMKALGRKDIENPKYGGTFRHMTQYATPSLDPATTSTGGSAGLHGWVYEKLFALEGNDNDANSALRPLLAESYSASTDLKTYTITLKKGIKWQNVAPVNGREFEAKDVVFTFTEYMKPTSVLYSQYQDIESVEATDKYTVTVKLKDANAHFIGGIQNRQEFIFPYDLPDRKTTAIGTGPFIVKSFTPGATGNMTAVRNPNYWQKDSKGRQLPYIDALEVISNPEVAPKIAAMRSGQVNSAAVLSPPDVEALLRSNPDIIALQAIPLTYGTYSIAFKTENAPWSDKRVRCAVSKAIDKEKVAELRNGSKGVVTGPFPWAWVNADRPLTEEDMGPCYKFDPDGAKKLLAEAGFGANNPLKAKRTYGHEGDNTTAENATIQQLLASVGIQMEIDRIDYTTYSTGIYLRQFSDWGAGFPATACSAGVTKFGCIRDKYLGRFNFGMHGSLQTPELAAKVKQLQTTTDEKKEQELMKYFWDYFVNEVPEVMFRANANPSVFTSNVRNVYVRQGIAHPLTAQCNTCRFVWFSDAPRTTVSALDTGDDTNGQRPELVMAHPEAVIQRTRARAVRI